MSGYSSGGKYRIVSPVLHFSSLTARTYAVTVVLGQPRSDCRHHGICRIEPAWWLPEPGCHCEAVFGWMGTRLVGGWQLWLPAGQLPPERERYHFDRPEMLVQEPIGLAAVTGRVGDVFPAARYRVLWLPLPPHRPDEPLIAPGGIRPSEGKHPPG